MQAAQTTTTGELPSTESHTCASGPAHAYRRAQPHGFVRNRWYLAANRDARVEWDFEDRLVKVTKSDGTVVENTYDVDGVLVRTVVNGVGTDYLVDTSGGLSHVVAEVDSSGVVAVVYVRAGDMLLEEVRGGVAKMYEADGLGSVRGLLDAGGARTDTYSYEAFGSTVASTGSDANPYRFAGERLVDSVGFYQNRARWLDTRTGRFVSADPARGDLTEPVTMNAFMYANADPVALDDPTGEFAEMMVTVAMYSSLAAQIFSPAGTSSATNSAQNTLILYNDIGPYGGWATFNRTLFERGLKAAIGTAVDESLAAASISRVTSGSGMKAELGRGGYRHVIYYGHMPSRIGLLGSTYYISPPGNLTDLTSSTDFAKMLGPEVKKVTLLACRSDAYAESLSTQRDFALEQVRGVVGYLHDWIDRNDSSNVRIWQDPSREYKEEWKRNPPAPAPINFTKYPRLAL